MSVLRERLTYANVMSTIAVFVAIGGTSYAAITLPRDSVGAKQIRKGAVGAAEVRNGSIGTREIRDRSIDLRDLSAASLAVVSTPGPPGPTGPAGPPGVEFRASVAAGGAVIAGNGLASGNDGWKELIRFPQDVSGCTPVASVARNGTPPQDPAGGSAIATIQGNLVAVETFTAAGEPAYLPFNLLVAC